MEISPFYLTFTNKDAQRVYLMQRRNYFAKLLPLITVTQGVVTLVCMQFVQTGDVSGLDEHVNIVNPCALVYFFVLSLLVRWSSIACWFVCPSLTCLAFYIFAFLEYNSGNVSTIFAIVVAINVSYFLLAYFSDVWLISVAVYAPMLAYYMWKTGADFVGGTENQELTIRCAFCVALYAAVAYRLEKANKLQFLRTESASLAQFRLLKVFETLPEGVAFVRRD